MTDQTQAAVPSSLERTLPLSIRLEDLKGPVQAKLRQIGRTAKLPGFRPGKVPMKMLEQMYGQQAQSEAMNDVISEAYGRALAESGLRPAGPPDIDMAEGDQPEGTLGFVAKFEVYPEISVPDLAGLSVQQTQCDITDEDLERTLDTLRAQRTEYVAVERAAQADDQVRLDFEGSIDGEVFAGGSAKDFRMMVAKGQMLPEFDNAIVGMSAGESKSFDMTFPEDYHATHLAGKPCQFTVTVHEVLEARLPELNDDLAVAFGIAEGGLEKLRAEVEKNLRREVSIRAKARTKQSVMDALTAAATFDVPKALVEQESQRLAEQMREDMRARGMNVDKAPFPAELFASQADKRVRLGLIVGEIVRQQNLQATPDDVRALLLETGQSYENPEEFVEWTLSQADRRMEAQAIAVEDKVVGWVLAGAAVEVVNTSVLELLKPTQD